MTKHFAGFDAWNEILSGETIVETRRKLDDAARKLQGVAYDLACLLPAPEIARLMVMAAEIERRAIDDNREVHHRN